MDVRRVIRSSFFVILAVAPVLVRSQEPAAGPRPLDDGLARAFAYRALGPARQCGRILHVAAPPSQPFTFYVSPGTGGLWRTTNNGTTFESILPGASNVPVGHFAVAPSDPKTIWVGTGDPASGRIPIRGFGVWKSSDGGRTWTPMGLERTRHIGRIAIHPSNPDVVYVAALGYHFSANPERGLYKTEDGGRTWDRVLDLGEKIGFVEVVIRPDRPEQWPPDSRPACCLAEPSVRRPSAGCSKITTCGCDWASRRAELTRARSESKEWLRRQPRSMMRFVDN